ncbi:MAG: tRNA (guanosine(37)-N1)-methyltransferase TrmD [Sandaracinaceae bacterium]|nr:tRNA (guanosine(37)-N1)-methyltransferase TrmD [Sandaracinaceae bacterium]
MHFYVVTIFPPMFDALLSVGLVGQAARKGTIRVIPVSPRDFAVDKHGSVDDAPYGGGHGMVMRPGPITDALDWIDACEEKPPHRVLLTPQGAPFNQTTARRLAQHHAVSLVCGRYEGFDERIRSCVDEEISIGDYVMTGGEVAAMAVIEASSRLLPGVLGSIESTYDESHADGSLEYPQYTRPPEFRGMKVPDVLLSGDHKKISIWRKDQSAQRTAERRPDLFARLNARATKRGA